MSLRFIIGALLLIGGCGSSEPEQLKDNFRYWYINNKTCAKMAKKNYCVDNDIIDAKAWQTDARPGFLVKIPIYDRGLMECNEKYYKINSNIPNITFGFGEDIAVHYKNDTKERIFIEDTKNWYKRRLSWIKDNKNYELLYPRNDFVLYGMNCTKASDKALLHQEFVCHEGTYDGAVPAHFFECDREGSVPNASCSDEVYYRDMRLSLHYSKQCAHFHKKIRDFVLKFIDDSEVKGER